MVRCLHQSNIYIKRKLWEWTAQKCNPCFCAKSPPRRRTFKVYGFMKRRTGPTLRIFVNSGLPFAMVPHLHQRNIYIKRKLGKWKARKCNPCFCAKSPPCSTGLQNTRIHAAPYRADIANLREFWVIIRHGTVFAPRQSLYQKEATGMESPKM